MRKTRLVILPTKCLHQMGFLLLFLSCPVIGDWGRIRPESEDSHKAIQIDREGTCGLERDPPGGLHKILNEDGSKQCRVSQDFDTKTPIKVIPRHGERQVESRRLNQQRVAQISDRRTADDRRVFQRDTRRNIRSRSVDSRRSVIGRMEVRTRSLSLNRLERERAQRSVPTRNVRQYNVRSSRRESERFHMSRQMDERQSERREQRLSTERQESERMIRKSDERRERERSLMQRHERVSAARLVRSQEFERRDERRGSSRRTTPEQSRIRENEMTRTQHKTQNERSERRQSPSRREVNDARGMERTESIRSDRVNMARRVMEVRRSRNVEPLARKSEQIENLGRLTRNDNRRGADSIRRLVTAIPKASEWKVQERRSGRFIEREVKYRKETASVPKTEPEFNTADDEGVLGRVTKWVDLRSYDGYNAGDWTTNCIIGAAVYFFTTRQMKAV